MADLPLPVSVGDGTYYAINDFVGDGTTTQWETRFVDDYLAKQYIYVDDWEGNTIPFAWGTGETIIINPPVEAGKRFRIFRNTPKGEPLVEFQDGAVVTQRQLNKVNRQHQHTIVEIYDRFSLTESAAAEAKDLALGVEGKATDALANANAANAASHEALAVANGIDGKASQALSKASDAEVVANDAKTSANTSKDFIDAYNIVLKSDDTHLDVPLPDGSTVPTVAKRAAGLTGAVTSVNGQVGDVVLDSNTLGLGSAALENVTELMLASRLFDNGVSQESINSAVQAKQNYNVYLADFGAKLDGVTDDTVPFKAALAHLKSVGGGTLNLGRGRILITSTIDLGDYCVLDNSSDPVYPLVAININLKGEGFKNTVIVWKGGTDSKGGYGTALMLRSKTLAGVETYYFGKCSDFNIDVFDLTTKKGHSGSWPVTNRFTTIASTIGGCNPVVGSLATYPTTIDKANPSQGASCGMYVRSISPAQLSCIQVRGFAFGFWLGVGYGTACQSIAARWCGVGVRFGEAITTTSPVDSIFEKNAVGVLFNVTSHVGLDTGCVVQGNYAGCDVLFHSWNRRVTFDKVYFEASVKGIVMRSDSSAQYRNSEISFKDCTGVQLDVDMTGISELYLENNHIQSTVFNTAGVAAPNATQHYAVRVKNNFTYDNATGERRKSLWTQWGIPDRYLYVEDTMPVTGFDVLRTEGISAGVKAKVTKSQVGSTNNDFVITVPNARASGVLRLEGVASRFGDDLKDVLYFTNVIAFTRQPNGVVVVDVGAIDSKLMAVQSTGISIGSPAVVTATVSGDSMSNNTITVKASKAALGGNSAIQTVDAKLIVASGTVQLHKV